MVGVFPTRVCVGMAGGGMSLCVNGSLVATVWCLPLVGVSK